MFSMNQILTGILSSDSATSVRKVRRHSSAEAIGGVRLRYVGALPGPAATRIHTKLAARLADGATLPHRAVAEPPEGG